MIQRRLLSLSLLLSLTLTVHATSVLPVDVGTMVDRAELIFVGTVTGTESVPTADGNFAFTLVTFDVEQTLKGIPRSGRTITLRIPGGRFGGNVWEVAGMPRFEPGGRHLLFVEGNRRSFSPLVGVIQGKLDLIADPSTGQPVLADFTGRAVSGVRDQEWRLGGRIARDDSAARLGDPGVAVVSEEGVRIEVAEAIAEPYAPAANAIAELRVLIAARQQSSAAFRQSQFVDSASAADVPATFVFTPVRPK